MIHEHLLSQFYTHAIINVDDLKTSMELTHWSMAMV